jgi:hypothetical protein
VGLGKAGKKSRPRDVTPSNGADGPLHDAIGDSGAAVEVMDRDGDVDIVVRK